ncbi:MAG: hypothetical protein H7Z40_12975, partial [Phycisphaerae bacterium]|nr:hypothetical protein [Gemmatimonadaceae bacterium]
MATELGLNDAVNRFEKILQQELACDQKLDGLATMLLPLANADDADTEEGDDDEDEEEEEEVRAPARKSAAKKAPAKKAPAKKAASRRR